MQPLLIVQSYFDFLFDEIISLSLINHRFLLLLKTDIAEHELTSSEQGNQNSPAKFVYDRVFLFKIVENLHSNLNEDLLSLLHL